MRHRCYDEINEYQKALEDINLMIKMDHLNPCHFNDRAVFFEKYGNYDKAIEDYSMAIHLNSEAFDRYLLRASCFYKMGDLLNAEKDVITAHDMISGTDRYDTFLIYVSPIASFASDCIKRHKSKKI